MKKWILLFFLGYCVGSSPAGAQEYSRTTRGMSEPEQLGITAGTALACNAGAKLDDFELIASRLIANKALTAADEQKGYREYAEAKFQAYNEQRNNPQATCGEVLASFNHLPIFRSVVYADGGVKMYDGSYLKPVRPVTRPAVKATKNMKKAKKK